MLTFSLVTPTKKVFADLAVEEVFIPTVLGELNILEGHTALMSILQTGILKYRLKGQSELKNVAVSWGFLEVALDQVIVLAETAETPETIDTKRAEEAKVKAEQALGRPDLEQKDFQKYQLKLERAVTRIQSSGSSSVGHTEH